MTPINQEDIDRLISGIELKERASDLGYFSKPFRIYEGDKAFFIKLYLPVKDHKLVSSIIKNHDDYITGLKSAGLKIPGTVIVSRRKGGKQQIIIIQESFRDEELLRNRVIEAGITEVTDLLTQVFDDIVQFLKRENKAIDTGFHPTLRNYALHEGELWFFDTFPPMLMRQRDLNAVILKMSPYGGIFKGIVPVRLINRVTDEYYHPDKMFAGIVGSCCRLRPGDSDKILTFSREYVNQSPSLSGPEKEGILELLKKPPELSKIWILIRKLSGNVGKPNINIPTSA